MWTTRGRTRKATSRLPREHNDFAFFRTQLYSAPVIPTGRGHGPRLQPDANIKARFAQMKNTNLKQASYFSGTCSTNCGASEVIAFDSAGSAAPLRTIASS